MRNTSTGVISSDILALQGESPLETVLKAPLLVGYSTTPARLTVLPAGAELTIKFNPSGLNSSMTITYGGINFRLVTNWGFASNTYTSNTTFPMTDTTLSVMAGEIVDVTRQIGRLHRRLRRPSVQRQRPGLATRRPEPAVLSPAYQTANNNGTQQAPVVEPIIHTLDRIGVPELIGIPNNRLPEKEL